MKVIGLGVNNRIGQSGSNFGRFKTGTLTAPVASGTLPSQSLQQGIGVVTYTSSGAFTGPVSSWSMTGGAAGISINTTTGVISVDRAVVAVSTYSLSVTATNAAGSSSPVGFSLNVFSASASTIGFRATLDSGTTGDLFVAKTGNDTTGTGTLGNPFLTIGQAISTATTGQEIKVRAGTYRESVDIGPKQLILSRYGTERVVITGATALTGGVACTVADLADVGPNWVNMYKFTVTTASIASSDPRAGSITEAGTGLNYAMAWDVNPRFPRQLSAVNQWLTASVVLTQPNPAPTAGREDHIIGYRLPSMTDLYTELQIERGYVHWHGYPNVGGNIAVSSFDPGTKTINFDGVTSGAYYASSGDVYKNAFALGNILPAMQRGGWGFITSGANTTFYVWPLNPANIASGMEYTTKTFGVKVSSQCELRGIEVTQTASTGGKADNLYAIAGGGLTKKNNIRIKNCRAFNTWRGGDDIGYGAMWIGNTDDLLIEDVTVEEVYGSYGFFISATTSDLGNRLRLRRVLVNTSEQSPARFYNQREAFISNLYVVQPSGLAAHANKTNIYEQGDKFVYHNCFLGGASGYMTWQETSRIAVLGCYVPTSYIGNDFRAIVDQNSSTNTPAGDLGQSGASYILRNTTVPYWVDPTATEGLSLGKANNMEVTYTVAANALVGAAYETVGTPALDRVAGNYFTSGSNLGGSNTTSTNELTYTDHLVGDMSYKAGAPIRSAPTTDISAEIAVIKSWLPDISNAEFDKDIYGNTVNWAAVKPGVSNDYDANFGLEPILIDLPTITGAPSVGGTIGTTPYFIVANPFPTITAKWQNSTDGITWTDISGATGATYVPVAGDVGKFVARLFTGTGVSFRSQSVSAVTSSYPLGDPVLMRVKTQAGVGSPITMQDETATYVSTGKPLLVLVSQRAASSADSTVTCTVGSSGRSYGTGTSLSQVALSRRNQAQTHIFWLAAPSAGTVTVQAQGSLTANSWRIQVFEVDALASFGATSTIGATTATTITSTLTTATANSGALYILNRFDGDTTTNPVSVSGSDPVVTGTTGGTSSTTDLAISTVYARTPIAGSLAKTFSWPVGRSVVAYAIELRS
jgi:Protein of unknown function (DUF1565)